MGILDKLFNKKVHSTKEYDNPGCDIYLLANHTLMDAVMGAMYCPLFRLPSKG